ncbi:MAG: hypothetical protein ACRYGK_03035 [Janthinobacterium lividum]
MLIIRILRRIAEKRGFAALMMVALTPTFTILIFVSIKSKDFELAKKFIQEDDRLSRSIGVIHDVEFNFGMHSNLSVAMAGK